MVFQRDPWFFVLPWVLTVLNTYKNDVGRVLNHGGCLDRS